MKYFISLFSFVYYIFTSSISPQSPGDLDSTFRIGGIARTDISGYINVTHIAASQSDSKVIFEDEGNGLITDFANTRYTVLDPVINLISPNGGEEWCAGATETIVWSQNFVGNVEIQLFKAGVFHSSLTTSTIGDGEFDWAIPPGFWGSDYRIKILSVDDSNIFDISYSSFSIVSSEITVISPNGGEVWYAGKTQTINWTSNCVGNVQILLLKNDQLLFIFSSSRANDGSMIWNVPPGLTGSGFKIRISSVDDANIFDESDSTFTITDVTGIKDLAGSIPDVYELFQNYPNPFNPSTTIYYALPAESSVKITIYDLLGNEVVTLVDEELPPGEYEVKFSAKGGSLPVGRHGASGGDAYDLPSGIYLYQIRAGVYTETKKMLFLK